MASHSVEETMYEGDFLEVIEAYRRGSGDLVDLCENKVIVSDVNVTMR